MHIRYGSSYSIANDYKRGFIDFMIEHFGREFSTEELQANNILQSKQGFFKEVGGSVIFYSGFLLDIMRKYKDEKITISTNITKYIPLHFNFSPLLYEHQKKILLSIFKNKRGLIQSPTGSGKSIVIAECVRLFNKEGKRIIITVPTIDLLNQLKNDIVSYFKLTEEKDPSDQIGLIGGGDFEVSLDKLVHICIPQSLCKLNKTKNILESCDVLIADEVHTTANSTYHTCIEYITSAVVRIGLSATPWTNHDNHILLKGFFGNTICKILEADMIRDGVIMEPKFIFYTSPKGFVPNKLGEFASQISSLSQGHRYKILNQVYNYLILNNDGRNRKIVELAIQRSTSELGPVIIIVNKVNDTGKKIGHATILKTMFESKAKQVSIISGSIKKKDRVSIIQNLKDSSLDIVIAGPKVLTAGISIPSLSTIILAGAGKSDSDLIQRIGRLLRKKEGKSQPLVIDFFDTQFWFENQSYTRMNVIKSIYGEDNLYVV